MSGRDSHSARTPGRQVTGDGEHGRAGRAEALVALDPVGVGDQGAEQRAGRPDQRQAPQRLGEGGRPAQGRDDLVVAAGDLRQAEDQQALGHVPGRARVLGALHGLAAIVTASSARPSSRATSARAQPSRTIWRHHSSPRPGMHRLGLGEPGRRLVALVHARRRRKPGRAGRRTRPRRCRRSARGRRGRPRGRSRAGRAGAGCWRWSSRTGHRTAGAPAGRRRPSPASTSGERTVSAPPYRPPAPSATPSSQAAAAISETRPCERARTTASSRTPTAAAGLPWKAACSPLASSEGRSGVVTPGKVVQDRLAACRCWPTVKS